MTQSSPSSPCLPGPVTAPGAPMPSPPPSPKASITLPAPSTSTYNLSVTEEQKRKQAWKYQGYDELSKWMASENDFFIFRRFESLNAETILYLQYRITQLEKNLKDIHANIANSDIKEMKKNSSFKWDEQCQQDRSQIMTELSYLLLHYSKQSSQLEQNMC
jgi:hypothetical protein